MRGRVGPSALADLHQDQLHAAGGDGLQGVARTRSEVDDVAGLHALGALTDGEVHLTLQKGDDHGLGRGVLGEELTGVKGED